MNWLATQIITTMLLTTPFDIQKAQVEPAPALSQSATITIELTRPNHKANTLRPFDQSIRYRNHNTAIAGTSDCGCDLDCFDGNPCTVDTCDENNTCQFSTVDATGLPCEDNDGDFCTIGECNSAGICLSTAANPCDTMAGETCDEANNTCIGNDCATDTDCDSLDNTNNCVEGACVNGYCESSFQCAAGFECNGEGTCNEITDGRCCNDVDQCALGTLASCDSGNGPWSGFWDCVCPKYSSFNDNAGVEYNVLLTAGEDGCAEFSRIGDDYSIENNAYLQLTQFRFFGGPTTTGTGNGVMVFEFWDGTGSNPVLVESFAIAFTGACDDASDNTGDECTDDADCPNGTCDPNATIRGSRFWTITFASPVTIPPTGYFAVRPGAGSGETVGIVSTNSVGMISDNNPDSLFWGEGETGAFLSPDFPDVLTFELIGNKIPDPTGACCLDFEVCDDSSTANTEWLCEAIGGQFVAGETCANGPCAQGGCCFADGSCQILDPETCTNSGANPTFAGTGCEPNCCPQPNTASNTCGGSTPIVIDTTGSSQPVTVRISGDNSVATNGVCSESGTPCRTYQANGEDCPPEEVCNVADPTECVFSPQDQGHWESFTILENAHVEIGYCCTDPDSDALPGFRWIIITDDCDNCDFIFRDNDGDQPVEGCHDGQPSDIYSLLPPGTYHYAVFSERYCENSNGAVDCTQDADCEAGTGPCITQTGSYELSITATPLFEITCCLQGVCVDTMDALECEETGGFPLDFHVSCFPVNPCQLGACCLDPGECEDNGGAGINQFDCELNPHGNYIGAARCADDPCPVCEIQDNDNCQQQTGPFILPIDRALWNLPNDISRWADDFTPSNTGPLDRVCWFPAFFDPFAQVECSAFGDPPPDNWEMTIYADADGIPGAVIAPTQVITPDAKVPQGATSRIWLYSAPIDFQPILEEGECYWLEITGEGEGDACTVYWTMSETGNNYFVWDQGSVYGYEDVITNLADSGHADLAFCVSTGLDQCASPTGACCLPDGSCDDVIDIQFCHTSGGVFSHGLTCGQAGLCGELCQAPTCNESIDISAPGEACETGLPCSQPFDLDLCLSTAEPLECNITTNIADTSWYSFTLAPNEFGLCTIDTCGSGNFDSVIAVYEADCPTEIDSWIGCADDTCGMANGMSTVSFPCCGGRTYHIAMGSAFPGLGGSGTMDISIDQQAQGGCEFFGLTPLADERFDVLGTVKPCVTDADCKANVNGPDAETVCRDSDGDGADDACYVARQRYLSVKPNQDALGILHTYRVSLDTGVAGTAVLGYTGQPSAAVVAGEGPNLFYLTRIEDTPHYMDWAALTPPYISIGDCQVSRGHNYIIQAIGDGDDILNETAYTDPLSLPTPQHWGDVTGGGNPGSPPNGVTGSLVDVFAIIKGFQNTNNEPKDWLDINPSGGNNPEPNMVVNMADAFDCVQAFQQNPYPGPDPLDCP